MAEIQALPMSEWSAWAVYFSRKAQQRELAAMRAR